ncbi:MAG: hypothetical protein AAGG50_07560 [Bacteroidota bacterium]
MSTDLTTSSASASPTQDELRAKLAAKEASIQARVEALRYEASMLPFVGDGAPSQALAPVRANPVVAVAGAVAVAALVSFVLAMRKKRKRRPAPDDQQQLVTAYLRTVLNDASARMARGRSADEALDQAFRKRPPIIVYGDTEVTTLPATKSSLFREGVRAAGNQAMRVGLSYALGRFQAVPSSDLG